MIQLSRFVEWASLTAVVLLASVAIFAASPSAHADTLIVAIADCRGPGCNCGRDANDPDAPWACRGQVDNPKTDCFNDCDCVVDENDNRHCVLTVGGPVID